MGMVPEQEYTPCGVTPSREPEHDLQVRGEQARLDLEQESVQKSQLSQGTHASGPLCNEDLQTAPQILQLETQSSGGGDRCLLYGRASEALPTLHGH